MGPIPDPEKFAWVITQVCLESKLRIRQNLR